MISLGGSAGTGRISRRSNNAGRGISSSIGGGVGLDLLVDFFVFIVVVGFLRSLDKRVDVGILYEGIGSFLATLDEIRIYRPLGVETHFLKDVEVDPLIPREYKRHSFVCSSSGSGFPPFNEPIFTGHEASREFADRCRCLRTRPKDIVGANGGIKEINSNCLQWRQTSIQCRQVVFNIPSFRYGTRLGSFQSSLAGRILGSWLGVREIL